MKTVLLVCSNKMLVMFVRILLRRMGFGMVSANTGLDALGMIDAVHPDIVIIDSDIAVFDGLETLKRLKEDGPSIPPVIMMVGTPDSEAERRCVIAGACTVIAKPVSIEDLHSALQECLFMAEGMKRRHFRAMAEIGVTVYHEAGKMELLTETLSTGGVYIRHDKALDIGSIVDLLIPLDDETRLLLTGRVIYNQKKCQDETGLCPGFAVKFIDVSPEDAMHLKGFISRLIEQDLLDAREAVHEDSQKAAKPQGNINPTGVYTAMQSNRRE